MTYVIEQGVLKSLGRHVEGLGSSCLVLHDRYATPETVACVCEGIGMGCRTLEIIAPTCSKAEARILALKIGESEPDLVVALGAGKVLDLTRAAMKALQPNRPALALVPLIVSSNACIGGLAVMYGDDKRVNGFWSLSCAPELVAVDLELVLGADSRFLSAAMGDQIASSFEAIHAAAAGENPLGTEAHAATLETIRLQGPAALAAVRAHEMAPELERVVRCVTYASSEQLTSSAVFMAHMLGEVLSAEPELAQRMHGEVVGACVPAELVAMGDIEGAQAWIDILRSLGIPASLAELGLSDVCVERIVSICQASVSGMMVGEAAHKWSADEMAEFVLTAENLAKQA